MKLPIIIWIITTTIYLLSVWFIFNLSHAKAPSPAINAPESLFTITMILLPLLLLWGIKLLTDKNKKLLAIICSLLPLAFAPIYFHGMKTLFIKEFTSNMQIIMEKSITDDPELIEKIKSIENKTENNN